MPQLIAYGNELIREAVNFLPRPTTDTSTTLPTKALPGTVVSDARVYRGAGQFATERPTANIRWTCARVPAKSQSSRYSSEGL